MVTETSTTPAAEKKPTITYGTPDPAVQAVIDAQRKAYEANPSAYRRAHGGGFSVGVTDNNTALAEANTRAQQEAQAKTQEAQTTQQTQSVQAQAAVASNSNQDTEYLAQLISKPGAKLPEFQTSQPTTTEGFTPIILKSDNSSGAVISASTPTLNTDFSAAPTYVEKVEQSGSELIERVSSKIPLARDSMAAVVAEKGVEFAVGGVVGVLRTPIDVPASISQSETANALRNPSKANELSGLPVGISKDIFGAATGLLTLPVAIAEPIITRGDTFSSGKIVGSTVAQVAVAQVGGISGKAKTNEINRVSLVDDTAKSTAAPFSKVTPGKFEGIKGADGTIQFTTESRISAKSKDLISQEDIVLVDDVGYARASYAEGFKGSATAKGKGTMKGDSFSADLAVDAQSKAKVQDVIAIGKVSKVSPEYLKSVQYIDEIMGGQDMTLTAKGGHIKLETPPSFSPQYVFDADSLVMAERQRYVSSTAKSPTLSVIKSGDIIGFAGDIVERGAKAPKVTSESSRGAIVKDVRDVKQSALIGQYKIVDQGQGAVVPGSQAQGEVVVSQRINGVDVEAASEPFQTQVVKYGNQKMTYSGSSKKIPLRDGFENIQETASEIRVQKVASYETPSVVKSDSILSGVMQTDSLPNQIVEIIEPSTRASRAKTAKAEKLTRLSADPAHKQLTGREYVPLETDVGVIDLSAPKIEKPTVKAQTQSSFAKSERPASIRDGLQTVYAEQLRAVEPGQMQFTVTEMTTPSIEATINKPSLNAPKIKTPAISSPKGISGIRPSFNIKSSQNASQKLSQSNRLSVSASSSSVVAQDITPDVRINSIQQPEIKPQSQTRPQIMPKQSDYTGQDVIQTSGFSSGQQGTTSPLIEPPFIPPITRPGVTTPKPFLFRNGKSEQKKRSKAYSVEVRRKKKFQRIGMNLTRAEALSKGAQTVRGTSAATFRIKESGTTDREDRGIFDSMRDFVQKKADTFIQKAANRISSRGEKLEITARGIAASRMIRRFK